MQFAGSNYLKGAVFGFAAVSIWASWSVITRLAVTTSLDAWDIAALRFGVARLLLSPVLVRRGLALDRLGWRGLAAIIAGLGAPYFLVGSWAGSRYVAKIHTGGTLDEAPGYSD
jgi:drug/metabolite transporter (DMT)-like permease